MVNSLRNKLLFNVLRWILLQKQNSSRVGGACDATGKGKTNMEIAIDRLVKLLWDFELC